MLLGLHSLLFLTKVKAAAASMSINFARMTPYTKGFFAAGKTATCSLAILFVSDWPPWMEVCRASLEQKRPYTHG